MALAPVQEQLRRCQSSFSALVGFFGEHPAAASETEFWSCVQGFVHAYAEVQRRSQQQAQVRGLL